MNGAMLEEGPLNASELLGLLKELNENQDNNRTSVLVDKTLSLLRQLPASGSVASFPTTILNQLHGMGVNLWNKAVTLKSAAAITLDINAQLRHVASTTVLLCNPVETSVKLTKKYITMGLKTGRAWLDCDNSEMAETSLQLAYQYWERMVSKTPLEAESTDSLRLLFRILCCQSEAALGVADEEKAIEYTRKAKDLLKTLDKEAVFLSMLCYNFGLQLYQRGKYESSLTWLKESYDIGRTCSSEIGAMKQARTLRLLATSYLELDGQAHWQKALNAVGLANSEHSHPAGLLLKARILFQYMPHVDDKVNAALEDVLNHPDASLDICVSVIRDGYRHGCKDVAIDALQIFKRKSVVSSDKEKLDQLHLELLLESGQVGEAKNVVESYIKACNSGGILNTKASQGFHTLLWEQASKGYENHDYLLALQWYQYSLVLFSNEASAPDQNVAKLMRNCCLCYMELEDYQKAEEMAEQAIQRDEDSVHSHFLLFKVSILLGKEEKAKRSLQALSSCSNSSDDIPGLLGLAAQMGFEKNNRSLAIESLECIARNPLDSEHALTSLRCLIRLKLTLLTPDATDNHVLLQSILKYLHMAHQHIENLTGSSRDLEATWFMKISWNVGLQAGEMYGEMAEAFEACRKFSSILPNDQVNYSRQRTCLLMAASATLQTARNTSQPSEKSIPMESVLSLVRQCQEVSRKCESLLPSDPTPSLLLLYQLEAQLYLGVLNSVADIMSIISTLPQIEPKLYETVAALVLQNPPKEGGTVLAQNALKAAINLYSESDKPNIERLSRCTHSLVQLLMGRESSSDMVGKEQAMVVLKSTLQCIEENGFPEMEVVWHMVKSWNTGIHLYSMTRYKEAESWCSLAMKFLPHLPSNLMETYQTQMTGIYDEILGKVEKIFFANEQ